PASALQNVPECSTHPAVRNKATCLFGRAPNHAKAPHTTPFTNGAEQSHLPFWQSKTRSSHLRQRQCVAKHLDQRRPQLRMLGFAQLRVVVEQGAGVVARLLEKVHLLR